MAQLVGRVVTEDEEFRKHLGRMLRAFGPIPKLSVSSSSGAASPTQTPGRRWIDDISRVVAQPWFFGDMSADEAIKVLRAVEQKFPVKFEVNEAPVGWAGIDASGKALPDVTLALCKKADAILFGSVGLPDRDPTIPKEERPERAALLRLRKEFGLSESAQ